MTFWVAGAAVVGGVGGAMINSRSAGRAAGAQVDAANISSQANERALAVANNNQAPWRNIGSQTLNQLAYGLGVDAGPNMAEGNFNVAKYLAMNPDAQEYMRTSGNSAYQHFLADGSRRQGDFWYANPNQSKAGRESDFDAKRYLELNPDAAEYTRTSGNTAYQHFLDDGERRTGDFWKTGPTGRQAQFNEARYLELNPDAREYMRTSGNSAYQHYLDDGSRRTGDFWNATPQGGGANQNAFGALNKSFSLADFQKDPGYNFRLSEGEKGVNRSASARGGLLSGATMKALNRYNQDYASNEFANAFNRDNINKTNQYNRLASLAGVGQTAATQMANQTMQTAQQNGQNTIGAGNARASSYLAQGNSLVNGMNQGISAWNNAGGSNSFSPSINWVNANGGGF